jgi:hypothetical protein
MKTILIVVVIVSSAFGFASAQENALFPEVKVVVKNEALEQLEEVT